MHSCKSYTIICRVFSSVDNIDLEITNEIFSLLGPNGAGVLRCGRRHRGVAGLRYGC